MLLGDEVYVYDPATYVVATVDLPISGAVIEATAERPYLGLALGSSERRLPSLLLHQTFRRRPPCRRRGLYVARTDRDPRRSAQAASSS